VNGAPRDSWARDLARAFRGVWYRGDRVECPCCGGRFRGFLAGGPTRRPGARCPRCSALERHRLVWLYLQERTALFRTPHRLLLIAPEDPLQRRLLRVAGLRVVSGDLDSALAMCRLDLQALPFRDATFDAALASHVLEHVADAHAALAELRRVLRPGGWAILQSPVDAGRATTFEDPAVTTAEERLRVFGQADHARIFGRDYPDWLRGAGFQVQVIPFAREKGAEFIARHGLDPDEDVHVCVRPGG
jgi:SAM-dependent methyltransferase